MAYMITVYVLGAWNLYERTMDAKKTEEICKKMQKEGEFKEELIRSMEECESKIGGAMETAFWISLPLLAFIFYHLTTVVYTHWKSFGQSPRHAEQIDEEENAN